MKDTPHLQILKYHEPPNCLDYQFNTPKLKINIYPFDGNNSNIITAEHFLNGPHADVSVGINAPVPIAQVIERPLREREVAGSKPGRAIPKALKMVPVATLLGAQHYKASTGFSHSLLSQLTLHQKKTKKLTPSTWFTGTRLMSPSGVKTFRKIDR